MQLTDAAMAGEFCHLLLPSGYVHAVLHLGGGSVSEKIPSIPVQFFRCLICFSFSIMRYSFLISFKFVEGWDLCVAILYKNTSDNKNK